MFLSAASFAVSFQYTILSYLMQIRNLNFRFFLKFYSSNDEYLFSLYSDIFLSSASLPAFSPFHTSFRSSFSPFSFPFLFSSSFLRFHASFFPPSLPPVLLLFFSLFSFSPCIFSAFMLYLSGCVIFAAGSSYVWIWNNSQCGRNPGRRMYGPAGSLLAPGALGISTFPFTGGSYDIILQQHL